MPNLYALTGSIYCSTPKKFWRLALQISDSFKRHSFSIRIPLLPLLITELFSIWRTADAQQIVFPQSLIQEHIIGKNRRLLQKWTTVLIWLNLKARVSIRSLFHIEKYLNQFYQQQISTISLFVKAGVGCKQPMCMQL